MSIYESQVTNEHFEDYSTDVEQLSSENRRTVTEETFGVVEQYLITVQDLTTAADKHSISLINGENIEVW